MPVEESSRHPDTGVPLAGRPALLPTAAAYGLMILGALGAFLLIRRFGDTLTPPPAGPPDTVLPQAAAAGVFLHVLGALTAVIVTGSILGRGLAAIGQPRVIGEVVAGILLGPSLLGAERSALILPPSVAPVLGAIAQLGVLLYMFMVGLELNAAQVRRRAHATVAISHASILLPFVLGALLALELYPRLSTHEASFTSFALFMGVAMSITAFPVLARILTDRGMARTELGVVALSCAATDDVTAWCLLAFVVSVVQAEVGGGLVVAAGTLAYVAAMLGLVRPIVRRLAARWQSEEAVRTALPVIYVGVLVSALMTEIIGIHAIFGAFLLGVVVPHNATIARAVPRQLEPVVTILLLPAFFAFTGMRTQINLLSTAGDWMICGAIIVVATAGKVGGTLIAARLTGLGWRDAGALGVLMNTRGLMELIVLNVGLELRVISPTLFAMMVLMALVTTMTTVPMLRLLQPDFAQPLARSRQAAP
jgi:Kef-type K+ transport system membrane component KefB